MLLAVDIGNTNISLGLFTEEELLYHWRLATDPRKTSDEVILTVADLLNMSSLTPEDVEGVVVASVVPPPVGSFLEMSRRFLKVEPLNVQPGIQTGIKIAYENPKAVGADRIANAVAGYREHGAPLIVVDFGTGTTLDAITESGTYLGGAIAPGMIISAEALFEKAAKLPRVEMQKPSVAIGRTTTASMQSGLMYGFAGQVDRLCEEFARELQGNPKTIATGGLAPAIAPLCKNVETIDSNLTLKGLKMLYELNE